MLTMRLRMVICGFAGAMACALVVMNGKVAQAQSGLRITSISGTISRGATITLNGSTFGTKPTAAPLKFDDFHTGVNGGAIGNGWNVESTTADPTYSTTILRANHTMSVAANFTNGSWDSDIYYDNGGAISKMYLDFWLYLDSAPPYSRNWKPFRLYPTTGFGLGPDFIYGMQCDAGSSQLYSTSGTTHWLGDSPSDFNRVWNHLQVWMRVNPVPGQSTGDLLFYRNGTLSYSNLGSELLIGGGDASFRYILLGQYMGHDAFGSCSAFGDAHVYLSDAYIDDTLARVEIGDASTYANSRHREIQIPSSWSGSSIAIKVNLGSFSSLGGLYMFVVDSLGNISPGFPLGGGTAPAAPLNLRIVR